MDFKCTFYLLFVYKQLLIIYQIGMGLPIYKYSEVNKMEKKTMFSLLALMIVGALFLTSMANAYRGDYSVKGPNYDEERHLAMENAFESLDYDAWKELMTENGRNPRVLDVVTEDNFKTFVQAHQAGINGDSETASALRAELGLNNGMGHRRGMRNGIGQGTRQNNFGEQDCDGSCQYHLD